MEGIQTRREWIRAAAAATVALGWAGSAAVVRAQATKAATATIVDKAGYDKVIAQHKGKVVLVDCWATWCIPCRKAFPKTVELSKAYADKGVVVVSLCFDDPVKGKVPEKVIEFLTKQNATFTNLVSSLDISTDGADAFKITDGALPHFKIYGRDGKLFKALESSEENEVTHEQVETAVKAALMVK